MTRTFKPAKFLTALLVTACLAGCARPELSMPLTPQQSDRLKIMWLHAYPHKEGVRLSGKVRRPLLSRTPVSGHLHIIAHHSDGSPPLIADTRWGRFSRRGNRTAPFAVLLRTEHPERIDEIKVEYRAMPDSVD